MQSIGVNVVNPIIKQLEKLSKNPGKLKLFSALKEMLQDII